MPTTPPDTETWTEETERPRSAANDATWTDEVALPGASQPPAVDSPDRYVEGPVLGRGGLADVRAARDRRLGREVAVKRLRRPDQATARQRFVREARVAAQLEHPNIVPVHDVGVDADGTPFYTMKYVRGTSLADALAGKADLGERLALLSPFISVCQAMAYAHDRRIIHRDLKPQNIMLGQFGEALVVDWGLARLLDESEEEAQDAPAPAGTDIDIDGGPLTRLGAVNGTPAYMAPEQARGEATGPFTDVYALGGILFEILTGRSPRAHTATAQQQLAWAREGFLPPVLALQPDAPRELVAIAERAMARVPSDRYATAAGMADDLQRWTRGLLVEAHSYSAVERVARWLRQYRTALALAAVGLLGMLVVGAVGFQRARTERDRAVRSEMAEKAVALAAQWDRARLLADRADRSLREGDPLAAKAFAVASLRDNELPDARGVLLRSWGHAGVTAGAYVRAPHVCDALALAADGVFCLGEEKVSRVSWNGDAQWTVPVMGPSDRLAVSGATLWVSTHHGVRGLDAESGALVADLGGTDVRAMTLSGGGEPMWLESDRAAVVVRGGVSERRALGPPFASAIVPGGPDGPTLLRALGRLERLDGQPLDVPIDRVAYDVARLPDGWLIGGADVVRLSDDGSVRSLGDSWGGAGRLWVGGDVAAMGTVRGGVLVVHLPTWSVVAHLPAEPDVRAAVALDRMTLVTAHGRQVRRWRVEPPSLPQRIEPGPWDRSAVRADGSARLLCGDLGDYAIWHAGEALPRPGHVPARGVTQLCAFDGQTAMLGWSSGAWRVGPDGEVQPLHGRPAHAQGHDEGRHLVVDPRGLMHGEQRLGARLVLAGGGTVVATEGDEASIWTWEGSTYTLTERVPIDEHTTIDVLADGTVGEHIEGSNTLRVRRPDGPVDFVGHASRVTAMSATGKPGVVATGAQDGTVILWRLDTAEVLATVPCGDGAVAVLEYDPVRDALDVATFDGRFHSLALAPLLVDANRLDAGLRQDHGVWVEDAVLRLSGSEEE